MEEASNVGTEPGEGTKSTTDTVYVDTEDPALLPERDDTSSIPSPSGALRRISSGLVLMAKLSSFSGSRD